MTATCNSSERADNSELASQEVLFLKKTSCFGIANVSYYLNEGQGLLPSAKFLAQCELGRNSFLQLFLGELSSEQMLPWEPIPAGPFPQTAKPAPPARCPGASEWLLQLCFSNSA